MDVYKLYYNDFKNTHKNELNIFLHLFTTLCGFFGIINILPYNYIFVLLYLFHLSFLIPKSIFYKTTLYLGIITSLSYFYKITNYQSLQLLIFSFLFQELSHYVTNESTMVSNYFSYDKAFIKKYITHSYLLLPLVIKNCLHTNFYNLHSNKTISFTNLEESLTKNIDFLANYLITTKPSQEHTTHIWYKDLNETNKKMFYEIVKSQSIFDSIYENCDKNMYTIENILSMDEIYVSTFHSKYNSDAVFYLEHIDGPFGLLPGISVNRTIIALTPNDFINTVFPNDKKKYTLTKGQLVSFDFNRTIHYINKNLNSNSPEYRIVIKAHYLIYPKVLKYYAHIYCFLTVMYDIIARKLFLYTLNPTSVSQNILTNGIISVTNKWYLTEQYLGMNNISYTFCIMLLAYLFNNFVIFLFYSFLMYIYSHTNVSKRFFGILLFCNILYVIYLCM